MKRQQCVLAFAQAMEWVGVFFFAFAFAWVVGRATIMPQR
jgi:hypothetical protein